jgi:hypothetical protein
MLPVFQATELAAGWRYTTGRARSLGSTTPNADEVCFKDFERDLDRFVQTIIQDLQERHHSD